MDAMPISQVTIRGSPPVDAALALGHAERETPAPGREPSEPRPEPSAEGLSQTLEGLNAFVAASNSHIQFTMHQAAHRLMVQVVDDESQEVIKTFPAKELLDLAARIGELVGALLDKKG